MGLASHPGALPWIRHCTVVVHYIQMYLNYILNKSWLCILSPGSSSFFLLRKEQNAHYHLRPLIHIFTWQGSPIPNGNGTNDRLFLLDGRHPPSMAGEVNDLYLHYRLPKLILKVQLSVQTEWKKNHEIIFLLFNLLNFVPKNDHWSKVILNCETEESILLHVYSTKTV